MPPVTVGSFILNKNVQEKYLDIVKTKNESDRDSVKELKDIINSNSAALLNSERIPNFGRKEEPKGFSNNPNPQPINNIGNSKQQVSNPNTQQPKISPATQNNNISKYYIILYLTIGHQGNTSSNTASITSTNKSLFSDSLNKYIQRAYEKCKTEADFKHCKISLTKTIQAALKNGDLSTKNFNLTPLPYIPSDEKVVKTANSFISDQERKNREKRQRRFAEGSGNITESKESIIKSNIEELTKELKIIVKL
jgi:hypothetical protein